MSEPWTGPREGDLAGPLQEIVAPPLPPERWPWGPPTEHEPGCFLHCGGRFCDCSASAED